MGTLIYHPVISPSAPPYPNHFPSRTQLSIRDLGPKFSSTENGSSKLVASVFSNRNSRSGVKASKSDERRFTDENGVVNDMDGYLNQLALEYESVWDTKPSWCQPWTITLTGVSIITCSWITLHSVIVSAVAVLLISTWWYIFLYSYPKAYSEMIAERRRKIQDGTEDTFGLQKNQ